MDLVEFMECALQKLPDAPIQRIADSRVHLSIPLDAREVSQHDHVRTELRRLSNNPAVGRKNTFFVQDGKHPRT